MHAKLKTYILFCLLLTTDLLVGKTPAPQKELKKASLLLPNNKEVKIRLAITDEEQIKGLSGVRAKSFGKNQGVFFFYLQDSKKGFWMPDTYMNLDILFLDKDLKIVHIEKNVKAHPGLENPSSIPRTQVIQCRHVLEYRADSGLSDGLKPGQKIKWKGPYSLSQTESKIRLLK